CRNSGGKRYIKTVQRHCHAFTQRFDVSFLSRPAIKKRFCSGWRRQRAQQSRFPGRKETIGDFLGCKLTVHKLKVNPQVRSFGNSQKGELAGMRQVKFDIGLRLPRRKLRFTSGTVRKRHLFRCKTQILRQNASHSCTSNDEALSVSFKMKPISTLDLVC